MAAATRQRFVELCRDVLRPLIEADDGKLYLVSANDDELKLHLGGSCSGCPGAPLTIRTLIEPAARAIDPNVRVVVTVGAKRPDNAVPVVAAEEVAEESAPDTQVDDGDGQGEDE